MKLVFEEVEMSNPNTAAGQKVMQAAADRRILDLCRTFNEIQISGNPLTPEEVRKLVEKRPHIYGVLEAHAS